MKEILQRDNPVLRQKAEPVPLTDIGTPAINKVIADMKEAMAAQKDGIAIAAPQIGVGLQIFVISGSLLQQAAPDVSDGSDMVFINPKISKLSKKKNELEEGCLSVRWLYGKVKRSEKATITAYDQNGNKVTRGASGLLAQIFQHETDHLEGILFIDHAEHIWEMSEEEIADIQK